MSKNTEHQKRISVITLIIMALPFVGLYEWFIHTPYTDQCVKSHPNDGQTEMTKHNICDEYKSLPNPYYRSTFP